MTATMTLPELTGSIKQIGWANDLRTMAISYHTIVIAAYDDTLPDADPERIATRVSVILRERRVAMLTKLTTETSAKWFIENKGMYGFVGAGYAAELAADPKRAISRDHSTSEAQDVKRFLRSGIPEGTDWFELVYGR